jgi:pyruvate formate lyase activating enzyme
VNVYVHGDKGCDCATENLPVEAFLDADPAAVHQVKKCAGSCCGSEGVLLKKYEKALGIAVRVEHG